MPGTWVELCNHVKPSRPNAKLCRTDTPVADSAQIVQVSPPSTRLKAQMLRAAVQDNADTIADRLPPTLRPARRLLEVWIRQPWMLALPASIVGGLVFIASASMAAVRPAPVAAASIDVASQPIDDPAPASSPDLSLLTRPLRARALALGVRRVILDPGHGGEHLGTESVGGLREKDLTLDLAERAKRLLVGHGFEVVLTRASDDTLSLKQRATTANEKRGDIFVSIHLNSLEPKSARGIETFYLGPSEHPEHEAVAAAENEHSGYSLADMRTLLDGIYADARRDESKRLARAVQDAVVRRLKKDDPAMADRGVKTAPFVVLVATDMPAILAEVSCLSNAEEAERLGKDDYRQTIAEALVTGIRSFVDRKPLPVGERKDTNER
jgi:N-acetylmuramoyl-L-alanine amidase